MVPALRERLIDAANQNGRSLNAEINYRLRESLTATPWSLRQTQLLADIEEALDRAFQFYPSAKPDRPWPRDEVGMFWDAVEELEFLNRKLQRRLSLGEKHPELLEPLKTLPNSDPEG